MNTPLTTPDGFPRADIDVAQIRTTRARIIRLKNDHKALMVKVEDAVHQQFAAGKPEDLPARDAPTRTPASGATPAPVVEPPFAKVNSVVSASPADQAGMKAGDKVTKFGSVNWTNHERLGRVAQVVQQSENVGHLTSVLRSRTNMLAASDSRQSPEGGRKHCLCHSRPTIDATEGLGRPWPVGVPPCSAVIGVLQQRKSKRRRLILIPRPS